MLRLIRGRGQERGAVAVIVGLVVALFVLTGVAALAIDGGSIYTQRRVAQNGADAASLALAQICAKNLSDPLCAKSDVTGADLNPYLTGLAGDNAGSANLPTISEICGGGTDAQLKFGDCEPPEEPLKGVTDCLAWPTSIPADVNWVAVKTRIVVPRIFAGLGDGTYGGKTVQACARAAWGPGYPPDEVVAVTDALCAWETSTTSGAQLAPEPPYIGSAPNQTPLKPVPVENKYVVKVLLQGAPKSTTDPATCGKNDTSSGQYVAGNFGWLDIKDGTACTADISQDTGLVGGNTGGSAGTCGPYLADKVGHIIYLPIFEGVTGTGNGAEYKINGVAAFFLAGFQAPSATKFDNAYDPGGNTSLTPHCIEKKKDGVDKDNGCLWGWFVETDITSSTGIFGGGTARGPILFGVAG